MSWSWSNRKVWKYCIIQPLSQNSCYKWIFENHIMVQYCFTAFYEASK